MKPVSKGTLNVLLVRSEAGIGSRSIVPSVIRRAGNHTTKRFDAFFTANIRNKNTRAAYRRTIVDFSACTDARRLGLDDVEPFVVAAYIEYLGTIYSKPNFKHHLTAIRLVEVMSYQWTNRHPLSVQSVS